jgi:hypothetical protein
LRKKKNKNRPNQKNKSWKSIPNKDFDKKVAEKIRRSKERVYTKAFNTQQSFGPASEVRIIDPSEYKVDGEI